jgi:hypothetical protein
MYASQHRAQFRSRAAHLVAAPGRSTWLDYAHFSENSRRGTRYRIGFRKIGVVPLSVFRRSVFPTPTIGVLTPRRNRSKHDSSIA